MSNSIQDILLELVESVEFDVSGDKMTGQGGHGGLTSNETIKVCGRARMLMNKQEAQRNQWKQLKEQGND